jgi:hypothetical protein
LKILDHASTIYAVDEDWSGELNFIVNLTRDIIPPEAISLSLIILVPVAVSKYLKKLSFTIEGISVTLPFIIVGNFLQGMGFLWGFFVSVAGFFLGISVVLLSLFRNGLWIPCDQNLIVRYERQLSPVYWYRRAVDWKNNQY